MPPPNLVPHLFFNLIEQLLFISTYRSWKVKVFVMRVTNLYLQNALNLTFPLRRHSRAEGDYRFIEIYALP